MSNETIYVKNMVCPRCIKVVKEELEKIGLEVLKISLGKVEVCSCERELDYELIERVLRESGFELLQDTRKVMVEGVKTEIIRLIYSNELEHLQDKLSELLQKAVHKDYSRLSQTFSQLEGITIERYFIMQKIERAKELLEYNEHTLSEISYMLGYSSVQHLSNQFKKITGMSPSYFKELKDKERLSISLVGNNIKDS